jgi:hypothetical protein
MKSKSWAIVCVILGIAFGFLQEQVKIETNFILEHASSVQGYSQMTSKDRVNAIQLFRKDHPFDYYFNHTPIETLMELNERELFGLKWALAFVFLLINAALVLMAFSLWIGSKAFNLPILWVYLGFLVLAVAVFGVSKLAGCGIEGYGFARKILGALQSPVPLMMLVPAHSLLIKHTKDET